MKGLKIIGGILLLALTVMFNVDWLQPKEMADVVSHLNDSGTVQVADILLLTQFSRQVEKVPAPNNGFMAYCVDESEYIDGATVKRPVDGNEPIAITNPTRFPLEIEQNDDTQNSYDIALHATKPQRISDAMLLQINYNARQGIIDRHMQVLEHKIARELLYNWSPTGVNGNIVKTTGADVDPTLAKWGATGKRKAVTKNDLIDATMLIKQDDVEDGTVMLIPAGFGGQMRKISDFIDFQLTGRVDMLAKGMIGMINGCYVMERSSVLIYNQGATAPVKPTFDGSNKKISVATNATQGILIWHPKYVYKAVGGITPYINSNDGTLLGGSVNFSQRAGGNKRLDEMGVVALVETFVS